MPGPAAASQPENAFVEVPYPPPAAHVETVPARPTARSVWIDGQWIWDGVQWTWSSGGWVEPQAGARFASWKVRRLPDGRLQFAPASWRDDRGGTLPPANVLAAAPGEASHATIPPRYP